MTVSEFSPRSSPPDIVTGLSPRPIAQTYKRDVIDVHRLRKLVGAGRKLHGDTVGMRVSEHAFERRRVHRVSVQIYVISARRIVGINIALAAVGKARRVDYLSRVHADFHGRACSRGILRIVGESESRHHVHRNGRPVLVLVAVARKGVVADNDGAPFVGTGVEYETVGYRLRRVESVLGGSHEFVVLDGHLVGYRGKSVTVCRNRVSGHPTAVFYAQSSYGDVIRVHEYRAVNNGLFFAYTDEFNALRNAEYRVARGAVRRTYRAAYRYSGAFLGFLQSGGKFGGVLDGDGGFGDGHRDGRGLALIANGHFRGVGG